MFLVIKDERKRMCMTPEETEGLAFHMRGNGPRSFKYEETYNRIAECKITYLGTPRFRNRLSSTASQGAILYDIFALE